MENEVKNGAQAAGADASAPKPKAPTGPKKPKPAPNAPAKEEGVLTRIGRRVLAYAPALEHVYVTADGNTFGGLCDAENHSKNLTDNRVVTVEKEKENE